MSTRTTEIRRERQLAEFGSRGSESAALGRLARAVKAGRTLGFSWLLFRLRYALQIRIGTLRHRTPPAPWDARPLSSWLRTGIPADPIAWLEWRRQYGPRFFTPVPTLEFSAIIAPSVPMQADAILAGRWPLFSHLDLM